MDPETLFNLYLEMSGHIDVINRELGAIGARLDWVEWWIKVIVVPLISINTLGLGANFWMQHRNNKNKTK